MRSNRDQEKLDLGNISKIEVTVFTNELDAEYEQSFFWPQQPEAIYWHWEV